MLQAFQLKDLEAVLDLWLNTNHQAHAFIKRSYWEKHLDEVRQQLPQAECYTYKQQQEIVGFIGLVGEQVAGLFIRASHQSQGIGKELLNKAKTVRNRLTLQVYEKNQGAKRFYQREGFCIVEKGIEQATGEAFFQMEWGNKL